MIIDCVRADGIDSLKRKAQQPGAISTQVTKVDFYVDIDTMVVGLY